MKTPKRHYELTTGIHNPTETMWDMSQEEVSGQRWKRKNREAQYKRTITRLKNVIAQLEREKNEAYHKGHKAGYDLAFARLMF